jgi:hypothetical protein
MAATDRRASGVEFLRDTGDALQLLPRWGAAVLASAWMAGITWLSSQPGDTQPGPWWQAVLWNGGHAPLFGLLGLWIALSLPRRRGWPSLGRTGALLVLGVVFVFGACDEFHQSTVAGRDFSALDLITDLTGASCVLWVASYLGDDRADDGGLARRVLAGAALCTLSALSATFVGQLYRDIDWL